MNHISIILVNPSHPGNIGGVARAMKNMDLEELRLVKPRRNINQEAYARASGANSVLDNAILYEDFANALADCELVIGTSARCKVPGVVPITPREAAQIVSKSTHVSRIGIVFGREHAGLTNEELALCQYHVQIPCNPKFSSLNLAAAVQIICYELRVTNAVAEEISPITPQEDETSLATQADIHNLFEHLEKTLTHIDFYDPNNPRRLMQKLRALLNRTQLQSSEVHILRGILKAVDKKTYHG